MSMRVLDAAIGAAWAMEEGALATLFEIASREHQITPEALAGYKAAALEGAEKAGIRNGVAVLNVAGPLFKRANLMTAYCGASSYDVLMRDLTTALDDGNVRAILVNVDSPGGEFSGCAEFAQAIFDARGRKPIVAYAGDMACSAAYWIASACDKIVAGPSAALGSVGVRATIPDASARDARSGVMKHEFVSSQSPYKSSDPKSDDGRARIQATVDALAQVFVETVARNRDVPAAKVLDGFGKGDVLIGAAAVAAGMADAFGTFETVVAELSGSASPSGLARAGARPEGASLIEVPGQGTRAEREAAEMTLATLGFIRGEASLPPFRLSSSAPEGERAAAMILDAVRIFEAVDPHQSAGEKAAAAILAMMPSNLQTREN